MNDAGEELLGVARVAGRTVRATWMPGRPFRVLRVAIEGSGRGFYLDVRENEIEPLARFLELARGGRDAG